jgi:SAM-dependent methyltransferase
MLTPARRRGVEIIDDPDIDAWLVTRSLADVARANTLFGGRRAVLAELAPLLPRLGPAATLLDVGTGLGDIPFHARRLALRRGVRLTTVGVELSEPLAHASLARTGASVCADAFRLPFADAGVDVVTCSQVLHHFAEPEAGALLRELTRVARVAVVVSDLRRSWLAAGGFWLASFPLGFHPVSRHDGVLSVFRGFTARELRRAVHEATGWEAVVRRRLGWRVTAVWGTGRSTRAAGPAAADARVPDARVPDAARPGGVQDVRLR